MMTVCDVCAAEHHKSSVYLVVAVIFIWHD